MKRKKLYIPLAILAAAALASGSYLAADAAQVIPSPGTAWGCVTGTSRILEHVYTVEANFQSFLNANGGTCPNGFPVAIGAPPAPSPTPTTTSPSPTPTTTSPSPTTTSPSPTTTSPSPTPTTTATGAACVTSAANGSCGPYDYPGISGSNGSNTYVLNNCWNDPSCKQTLTAQDPGNWQAVSTEPSGNTAVMTYPDTQQIYTRTDNTPDPLSSFSAITSSFTETMNPQTGTSAEAAYDIWAGQSTATNYADEIMIWNDTVNRGDCGGATVVTTATFGSQSWTLCKYGSSELIWLLGANETSGTVDILAMMNYLVTNGYLPAGTGLNQIDYGFEICSTGGSPETFAVSSFSITAR